MWKKTKNGKSKWDQRAFDKYIKEKHEGAIKTLWSTSDDAIGTQRFLSEIYDNVPKALDISVLVNEFHTFDCNEKVKKKVMAWLNKK